MAQNGGMSQISVVFVCTGDICRAPMAQAVCDDALSALGVRDRVSLASVGLGDWHIGEQADPRALQQLESAGLPYRHHRARLLEAHQLEQAGLFVAMERSHANALHEMAKLRNAAPEVRLLRSWDPSASPMAEIGDPYHRGEQAFEAVFRQVEVAVHFLVQDLTIRLARLENRVAGLTPHASTYPDPVIFDFLKDQ